MDPNEAFRLFVEALAAKRYGQAKQHHADLVGWIECGGFHPSYGTEWNWPKIKAWKLVSRNRVPAKKRVNRFNENRKGKANKSMLPNYVAMNRKERES